MNNASLQDNKENLKGFTKKKKENLKGSLPSQKGYFS